MIPLCPWLLKGTCQSQSPSASLPTSWVKPTRVFWTRSRNGKQLASAPLTSSSNIKKRSSLYAKGPVEPAIFLTLRFSNLDTHVEFGFEGFVQQPFSGR